MRVRAWRATSRGNGSMAASPSRGAARSGPRDAGDHSHREPEADAIARLEIGRTLHRAHAAADRRRGRVIESHREIDVAIAVDVDRPNGPNGAGAGLG